MLWMTAAYAVFLWWFATGAILLAVVVGGKDRADYIGRVLAALPVLVMGCSGVVLTRGESDVTSVFIAFTSAVLIWGWFELAFLAGVITGPNTSPNPPGIGSKERFLRAWRAVAYAELALFLATLLILAVSVNSVNKFALWTFLVLFAARISAKINVYLGVPYINEEFLPGPVRHLAHHFKTAPMNRFFPLSVTLLTAAAVCWAERAYAAPAGSGAEVGFVLVAVLTALALLEHWFMVLKFQDAALWRWLLAPVSRGKKPITR